MTFSVTPMVEAVSTLAGRRAFVTGANTGIGRALALACARGGADVLIHHCGDGAGAKDVASQVTAMGRCADLLELDFSDTQGVVQAADSLADTQPAIDILILNAAIEHRRAWTEIDADLVHGHVSINLTASLLLMTRLVDAMAQRGWGRVVAIGSVLAARPRAEATIYASLKSAQLTAMRAIARDVAAKGVTMNVVSPGSILTDRSRDVLSDPDTRRFVERKIPAGRIGEPEDCVAPVLMLCSDAASYITGADIPVDGGWRIGDAMERP
ncbi:MAG: SDR family NAD(P)-dependent oxidoreductase [Hyphomicrobiales bacterium]